MPRKKKRAVRGAHATGTSTVRGTRGASTNYAWHRRVPWVAIGGGAGLLVIRVLAARPFGGGGGAGPATRAPAAASATTSPRAHPSRIRRIRRHTEPIGSFLRRGATTARS